MRFSLSSPAIGISAGLPSEMSYLHDLVLKGGEEEVDDLVLLDGERVEVDLLHGLDLASLHETTKLGHGLPLLLLALCAATGATTATTSTATVTAALSATTGSKSTSVGHFDVLLSCPGGLVVVGGDRSSKNREPRFSADSFEFREVEFSTQDRQGSNEEGRLRQMWGKLLIQP